VDLTGVDTDAMHATSIALLRCTGVIEGYPAGTFRPAGEVTRGQLASFLVRALDLDAVGAAAGFPDVDPAGVHADAIAALVRSGIADGFADGTFCPGDAVTCPQAASFPSRALRLEERVDMPGAGFGVP
jgi:hypothetical protein